MTPGASEGHVAEVCPKRVWVLSALSDDEAFEFRVATRAGNWRTG
jgi:hypothetical protein